MENNLESLAAQIHPQKLARKGFPRPRRVSLTCGTDSTGEEAIFVYLLFPDDTPDSNLEWPKIEPMVSWVRHLLWTRTGQSLWPYVQVKREGQIPTGLA